MLQICSSHTFTPKNPTLTPATFLTLDLSLTSITFPKSLNVFFLHVSRNTSLLHLTSVLISQRTAKAIPLKLLLPLHWITSSHVLTMVKPASQYVLTSVQPSTP